MVFLVKKQEILIKPIINGMFLSSFHHLYDQSKHSSKLRYYSSNINNKEGQKSVPPLASNQHIKVAGLQSFIGISSLALLHYYQVLPLNAMLIGSFGASAALIYGGPQLPVSQPYNVIVGHAISSFIGVSCYHLFTLFNLDTTITSVLIASASVSLSIMAMLRTKSFHPPSAGNGIIYLMASSAIHDLNYLFVLQPCILGASILCTIGYLGNNILTKQKYPTYWWPW